LWGWRLAYKLAVIPMPPCAPLQGGQGAPASHTTRAGATAAAQY